MSCNHRWRKVSEEHLIGGYFPAGWECVDCGEFETQSELGAEGLPGTTVKGHILYPPHHGIGQTSDGRPYTKQVVDETGKLTIERP